MENDYANDNEPNPWSSIGLQAAMILNKLRVTAQLNDPKHPKNGVVDSDKRKNERADEHRKEQERADLERRVADILAMENRLRRNKI